MKRLLLVSLLLSGLFGGPAYSAIELRELAFSICNHNSQPIRCHIGTGNHGYEIIVAPSDCNQLYRGRGEPITCHPLKTYVGKLTAQDLFQLKADITSQMQVQQTGVGRYVYP